MNIVRKGNQLVLTIEVADKPTKSKSALQKAYDAAYKAVAVRILKDTPPEERAALTAKAHDAGEAAKLAVPATLLYSSGGFVLGERCKASLNVIVN